MHASLPRSRDWEDNNLSNEVKLLELAILIQCNILNRKLNLKICQTSGTGSLHVLKLLYLCHSQGSKEAASASRDFLFLVKVLVRANNLSASIFRIVLRFGPDEPASVRHEMWLGLGGAFLRTLNSTFILRRERHFGHLRGFPNLCFDTKVFQFGTPAGCQLGKRLGVNEEMALSGSRFHCIV